MEKTSLLSKSKMDPHSLTTFFLEVLKETATGSHRPVPVATYLLVPAERFNKIILDHFKLARDAFKQVFKPFANDYLNLWQKSVVVDWNEQTVTINDKIYRVEKKVQNDPILGTIVFMEGFLSTETLNQKLINTHKAILAQRENKKNPVGHILPHKNLARMIVTNDLKGKELIQKCNLSAEINNECNKNDYQLFKERLLSEFGVNFNEDSHGFPDARKLYMQMYTVFGLSKIYETNGKISYGAALRQHLRYGVTPAHIKVEKLWLPPYRPSRFGKWIPVKEFFVIVLKDEAELSHSFIIEHRNTGDRLDYDGGDPLLDEKFNNDGWKWTPGYVETQTPNTLTGEFDTIMDRKPNGKFKEVAKLYRIAI